MSPADGHSEGPSAGLELWAGFECTVNRVRDEYFDQLEWSGHATRLQDLDLLPELGVLAVRYPVLWERTAPEALDGLDWRWPDERLSRLRQLEIAPILGLLHHGSGPRYTSLVDPSFPEKLARYARSVAERYPWAELYTPVNEPLTTGRFSGLYGHWYPHGKDDRTFIATLLNQCRGVALAMQAVRQVNPRAKLIQTEDLGKIYSTPRLAYQAEFENERRWLSLDLLCGRLDREHMLWPWLCGSGASERELDWFLEHPCTPDVMGINHYLSSERFLDERLDRYPEYCHGGNGRESYADVLASRVCLDSPAGPEVLLREVWDRYQQPVAVTETHNGCTRDEQLRWFMQVWGAAESLRRSGVDVRAVTAWSLLGAYGWDTLATTPRGNYEPGVFDLRSSGPRPTIIAKMMPELAAGRGFDHPVLDVPGWWQRPERLWYRPEKVGNKSMKANDLATSGRFESSREGTSAARVLAITGATGTLGRAFARICELRGLPYRLLSRQEMDISNPSSVENVLRAIQPWALINAAGYVRVDDAEAEPDRCYRENTIGPNVLAAACGARGTQLVTFSSDLVFNGEMSKPYVESDAVEPLNVYGLSKARAEQRVLETMPEALVIRTSAFFGPWDEYNFIAAALRTLAAGGLFVAANDEVISPTYVPDLVNTTLDLLIDGEKGVWHIANRAETTWAELARCAAELAGVNPGSQEPRPMASSGRAAERPSYSALTSERGAILPSLDDAVDRYLVSRELASVG